MRAHAVGLERNNAAGDIILVALKGVVVGSSSCRAEWMDAIVTLGFWLLCAWRRGSFSFPVGMVLV